MLIFSSCTRAESEPEIDRGAEKRRTTMKQLNQVNLVKIGRKALGRFAPQLLVLLLLLLAAGSEPAASKTHHSKRQASLGGEFAPAGQQPSGRESSNWWNLWWQQYINATVQPTVRPIVGVYFNGKSISLSADEPLQTDRSGGDDNELQVSGAQRPPAASPIGADLSGLSELELERNAAAQQMAAAQQKSAREQSNWMSARPKMIQMSSAGLSASRASQASRMDSARQNRQANQQQQQNDDEQLSLGIQMRSQLKPRQQQSVFVQQLPVGRQVQNEPSTGGAMFSEQSLQQQQHQMVDYGEEGEPELMVDNVGGGGESDSRTRPLDSSSSSMMMPEQPPARPAPGRQDDRNAMMDNVIGAAGQQQPATSTTPDSTTATGQRATTTSLASTTKAPPSTTGKFDGGREETAPSGGASTASVELNETPISIESDSSGSEPSSNSAANMNEGQQQTTVTTTTTSKPTTAPEKNRLELMNGRPVTEVRPTGTTSSARLPSIATQTQAPTSRTTSSGQQPSSTTQASTTTVPGTSNTSTRVASESTNANSQRGESQSISTVAPPATSTVAEGAQPASSSGSSSDKSTTTSGEAEEDDQEDSEDESEGGSGGNLMNSAGEESASDDDSAEDSAGEGEEGAAEQTTTTARPTSAQQQTSTTTQQPSMTTIDIERLPKGGQSSAEQSQSGAESDRARLKTGEAANNSSSRQKAPKNFVMMTLDRSRGSMDGETAIAIPMDSLMRMMMNQKTVSEQLERLMGSAAASESGREPSSTTTQSATSEAATTPPATTTTTSSPVSASSAAEEEAAAAITTLKQRGKLQPPPPTTRMPPAQSQTTRQDQLQTTQSGSTQRMSTDRDRISAAVTSSESDAGLAAPASSDESGGREAKIEVLNMDLIPIQRLMGQQQQQSDRSGDTRKVQQETRMGQQQPTVLDVEPGMRLRPVQMQQTKTNGQQQMPNRMLNPPNTVYMIMMSNQSSINQPAAATTQTRPAPTVQQTMTTNPMPIEQPRQQASSSPRGSTATSAASRQTQSQFQSQPTTKTQQPQPAGGFTPALMMKPMMISQQQQISGLSRSGGGSQRQQAAITAPASAAQQTSSSAASLTNNNASQPADSATTARTSATGRPTPARTSMSSAVDVKQNEQMMRMVDAFLMATQQQQKPQSSNNIQREFPNTKPLMQTDQPARPTPTPAAQSTPFAAPSAGSQLERSSSPSAPVQKMSSSTGAASSQPPTTSTPVAPSTTTSAASTPTTTAPTTTTTLATTTTSGQTSPRQSIRPTTTTSSPLLSSTSAQASSAGPSRAAAAPSRGAVPSSDSSTTPASTPATTLAGAFETQTQTAPPKSTSSDKTSLSQRLTDAASGKEVGKADRERSRQQLQPTRRPHAGKVNTSKALNSTSSFIPAKLRNDFSASNSTNRPGGQQQSKETGAKLIQPQEQRLEGPATVWPAPASAASAAATTTTTTQSPAAVAQSMAIRQFGGANRMSLLANQPVPFGRPSAMTMLQTNRPASSKTLVEVPTFEYGPSIAVRRPDEALANGQVPNCTLTGKNFCVLTKDYPMNEVRQAVERSFRSVRIMYEELQTVSDQELHKEDFNATNNRAASGTFACQTQTMTMKPGWAKDEITKEWMLIVNTDVFPQRVRTESCVQPNAPCEFIAPFYDSTCQQRYSLHRMIAIDPHDPSRSPQVTVFKFPAGCVCRVNPIRKTSATTLAPTTPLSSAPPSNR